MHILRGVMKQLMAEENKNTADATLAALASELGELVVMLSMKYKCDPLEVASRTQDCYNDGVAEGCLKGLKAFAAAMQEEQFEKANPEIAKAAADVLAKMREPKA